MQIKGVLNYQKFATFLMNRREIYISTHMLNLALWLSILCANNPVVSQTSFSNQNAENVLNGNYNPASYTPGHIIQSKDSIIDGIISEIEEDSLKAYLVALEKFGTRNSGSDTISSNRGIGAARRWIHKKFVEFSAQNDYRLEVGYLTFFKGICSQVEHRNVMAVLPGLDTSKKEIVLVEAHMDSRCESSCDTACYAPGMDDNGSGTVLVMELARVMSKYSFDRTIVFTTVTAEEQGLQGGSVWAKYFFDQNIDVLACLNNDIVGGVECGLNSSPPSCSPVGAIDSLNLRVFSYSPQNDSNLVSQGKQLARYVKLQQIEEINTRIQVPVNLNLQIREDRQGRGGDHIPFRQYGFSSIRFTSAHEHGDGSGQSGDRQHSVNDMLGLDLSVPPDGKLDTFFIDFSYLKRNVLTNAINISLLAKSPRTPQPIYELNAFGNLENLVFQGPDAAFDHRVGIRRINSPSLYFDTVLTFSKNLIHVSELTPGGNVQLHCMNVAKQIESIPVVHHSDRFLRVSNQASPINCLNLYPNPASNLINVRWKCALAPGDLFFRFYDIQGREVLTGTMKEEALVGREINIESLDHGLYEVVFSHQNGDTFHHKLIVQ